MKMLNARKEELYSKEDMKEFGSLSPVKRRYKQGLERGGFEIQLGSNPSEAQIKEPEFKLQLEETDIKIRSQIASANMTAVTQSENNIQKE